MKTNLTPALKAIADKVLALEHLTATTGFFTRKSRGMLLANLTPEELAAVAQYIQEVHQQAEVDRVR